MSETGLTIFFSYAHEDESFRKDFEKHLSSLKREGLVEEWHDRMITAGQDWEREIDANLDRSHIIIFLISPDFMASRYCSEVELKRAMQRHEIGTARVIPVIVRPTDWQGAPFSKLQAIPTNALPISEWKGRDAAFVDVVQHLRKVCLEVSAIPGNPANPYVIAAIGDWYEAEMVIDIPPTSETKLATLRMTLAEKRGIQATVRVEIKSIDLGNDERTLKIPLDRPLEDSYGPLVSSVSEQIPANATIESRRIAGGTEKLFIGGKTFYTTWIETETEIRWGRDRLLSKGKTWMSSVVPLDGIVKSYMEIPGIITQTMIVTAYGRRGQVSGESVSAQKRSATVKQPTPEEMYHKGIALWGANGYTDPDLAIEYFTQAIRLDQNNANTYHARGLAYHQSGRFDAALNDFGRAINLYPDDAEFYNARGNTYYAMNKYEKARQDWKKACEMGSTNGCNNIERFL